MGLVEMVAAVLQVAVGPGLVSWFRVGFSSWLGFEWELGRIWFGCLDVLVS